jgi:hypothetical protein
MAPSARAAASSNSASLPVIVEAKKHEVRRDLGSLHDKLHPEAVRVDPATLKPIVGRGAIVQALKEELDKRTPLYFYLRQPRTMTFGKTELTIANFETGVKVDGKTVEMNGKAMYVSVLGADTPRICAEVLVPNLNAGAYGSLGTALTPPESQFGIFPYRSVPPPDAQAAPLSNKTEATLFAQVRQINESWAKGDTAKLYSYYNPTGAFAMGDYSPFYLDGMQAVREHFDDFYRTSKVDYIREFDPVVRIFGEIALVAYGFDSQLEVSGAKVRSPGKSVYVFTRAGLSASAQWTLAACDESSIVYREIGDPYPTAG